MTRGSPICWARLQLQVPKDSPIKATGHQATPATPATTARLFVGELVEHAIGDGASKVFLARHQESARKLRETSGKGWGKYMGQNIWEKMGVQKDQRA